MSEEDEKWSRQGDRIPNYDEGCRWRWIFCPGSHGVPVAQRCPHLTIFVYHYDHDPFLNFSPLSVYYRPANHA